MNKSLLPPTLVQLKKVAGQPVELRPPLVVKEQSTRQIRRRFEPEVLAEIVSKYEHGATTPALCAEYGLSKTGILKLLREEGVDLRRRPLTDTQVTLARTRYEQGKSIAAIATQLETSYNNVRQRLIKDGVELRPRGGTYR